MQAEHKLSIQELLGRVAYGYDERDFDMLEDCFTEDAVFSMSIAGQDPIPPFSGRAKILELMRGSATEQTDQRRHVTTNIYFTKEGDDSAHVISTLTLTGAENGAIRLISTGIYSDDVVRVDGVWRIAHRDLQLDLPYA